MIKWWSKKFHDMETKYLRNWSWNEGEDEKRVTISNTLYLGPISWQNLIVNSIQWTAITHQDFTFLQAQLVYDHLNEVSFGLLGLVFELLKRGKLQKLSTQIVEETSLPHLFTMMHNIQ